jgi:hypothetical protein
MSKSPSARDVLDDIEFEIAQGAISRDDLGQSIQAVTKHLHELRGQAARVNRAKGYDPEMIGRLLQLDSMLITLIQEVTATVNVLRDRTAAAANSPAHAARSAGAGTASRAEPIVDFDTRDAQMDQILKDLDAHMSARSLHIEMNVRASQAFLIGPLLTRVRVALHHLVLFYVRQLADRQKAVNRLYGEHIRDLTLQVYALRVQVQHMNEKADGD